VNLGKMHGCDTLLGGIGDVSENSNALIIVESTDRSECKRRIDGDVDGEDF